VDELYVYDSLKKITNSFGNQMKHCMVVICHQSVWLMHWKWSALRNHSFRKPNCTGCS